MDFLTMRHEKGTPLGNAMRLGLVVLSTDQTVEPALRDLLPCDDTAVYVSRVAMGAETSLENLRALERGLAQSVSLLPQERLDIIAFACTSGTIAIGVDVVSQKLSAGRSGVATTNPISAAIDAFAHLGAKRIALLTPYVQQVNREIINFLTLSGIETCKAGTFNVVTEQEIAEISTQSIVDAAVQLDDPLAEAIFISCTGLRSHLAIDAIEQRIGKPVITSNQAMAWKALHASKYNKQVAGFGRLLSSLQIDGTGKRPEAKA